jgi:hypothetical protein
MIVSTDPVVITFTLVLHFGQISIPYLPWCAPNIFSLKERDSASEQKDLPVVQS